MLRLMARRWSRFIKQLQRSILLDNGTCSSRSEQD
jgi:hypothetical protein